MTTMLSAYTTYFIIVIAKSDFQGTRYITHYGVSYGKIYFQPSLINTITGLHTSFTTPAWSLGTRDCDVFFCEGLYIQSSGRWRTRNWFMCQLILDAGTRLLFKF